MDSLLGEVILIVGDSIICEMLTRQAVTIFGNRII